MEVPLCGEGRVNPVPEMFVLKAHPDYYLAIWQEVDSYVF